jgi:membrane dipeptidase
MNAAIDFLDHRADPAGWARQLGISKEAVDLYLDCDVVDLHIDMFIWWRVFRYDLFKKHGRGIVNARGLYQTDIPRLREAQIAGGLWSITTNPLRSSKGRAKTFKKNLGNLRRLLDEARDHVALARNLKEYREGREAGKHVAMLSIQGGNALDHDGAIDLIEDDAIVRITLVHLSTSSLGTTSAPGWGKKGAGLTDAGRDYVRQLNERRILVDLAHISREGFFAVAEVHDNSQPLIVTHTGVDAVKPHWRNLTDEQLHTIADTGGTIGVMYQSSFLGDSFWGGESVEIVDHLEHIVNTVGEDHASLGSDWDGLILPPRDMPTCLELPKLVQHMLDRKWSPERIRKILGDNFLRTFGDIRPGT